MKEKIKNILNVLLDIFIVLFLLFTVLVLVVSLTQKTGNVSHIFGYTIRSVQTESMEKYNEDGTPADGAFFVDDLIVMKLSDRDSYEVGETVMFYMPIIKNSDGSFTETEPTNLFKEDILVTHNIIEVVEKDGITCYRTQGINNLLADTNLKTADEIIAVYNGFRIGGVGKAIDFVQSPIGFLVCIILPILVFVIIQAIRVIKNFIAYKAQKLATEGAPSTGELSEEEKRRIAEEYMRQLASNDAQPSTGDAPAEGE